MNLFLSNYVNKLDKKGRVSIPAQFRNVLNNAGNAQIITYQSFINNCVEACSPERIEKLHSYIDGLDPFSEQKDAFATAILGGSQPLSLDGEGRVLLPEEYIEFLSLKENVSFVGKGNTFEIWQPETFKDYAARSRDIALTHRLSLKSNFGNVGGRDV